jgi:putative phosphoesterase
VSRVGIISDTHDNLDKVRNAIALFNSSGLDQVVHCGDIVAQFVLVEMNRLDAPLRLVFGNCDGDRAALRDRAQQFGFTISEGPQRFELGGRRFVVNHQPIAANDCDFFLHGHTHRLLHQPGTPTVINPGEAAGWLTGRSTVAVLDADTSAVEFFDI